MKKIFSILAFMAMVTIPMMAQDSEYPITHYDDYYVLDGVSRTTFTSKMVQKVVASESRKTPDFTATVRRWYGSGFGELGYGYDTIATYVYENSQPLDVNDSRLLDEENKDLLWTLMKVTEFSSATDSVVTLTFNYFSSTMLGFYTESDTTYTAYAGRPYPIQQANNPLQLPLSYTSSDENVATVNATNGYITVVGKGVTMIKASFAGDEDVPALSAEWKLVVKEGDFFDLRILSKEQTEHIYGGLGGTYMAFDMIQVTEYNASDIYGDGTLSFDIKTRTLTINNYRREFTEDEDQSMGFMYWLNYASGPLPLTIKVIGDCFVKHNSAGIYAGWDLFVTGEEGSRLTMNGRFPQFSADNDITINGCQVHATESTPHPLLMCNVLRVEDNSYFEAYMDLEDMDNDPSYDPRDNGAVVGQLNDVEFGENIIMLTKDVHIAATADGMSTFVDGSGRSALRVEIGPKFESNTPDNVGFASLELTDDPLGTEQDGVLYTLSTEDKVDSADGCLVLHSTNDIEQITNIIDSLTPGSAAFAEAFDGLCFLLPVGTGSIEIDLQTTGNYQLAVQIGKNEPALITKSEKGIATVPFDLQIATFAYVYAVAANGPDHAPAYIRRNINQEDPTGSVRLYSIKVSAEQSSGVEDVEMSLHGDSPRKLIRDGQILILRDGKVYTATGVEVR